MKKVLVASIFSLIFLLYYPVEKKKVEKVLEKSGFNIVENNSIIVEGDNSCFKYIRPKKIKKEKNLMIVAHPDDETIWGGGHLIKDDYYVVCITCGNVSYRNLEFQTVMEKTNDEYIFLYYPDLTNGHIDSWEYYYDDIKESLNQIINSRNWNSIVTHNPEGEYGHIHHQMTSSIVTDLTSKEKLYYFGKYYYDYEIPEMETLDNDTYSKKMNELISVYVSQPIAMNRHHHMMIYEKFIPYNEW